MKRNTKICLAVLATSVALPALAQRIPVGGSSTNTKAPENARIQETEEQTTTTTGRKLVVSRAAQKPILDLQTAVNANDTANIPAKLAAAQAVAKSPDEKFAVASKDRKSVV